MKKIFFVVFLLVSLLMINNLVRSIYTTWNKKDLLKVAQKQLEKEEWENQRLKTQLTIVNSPDFVEKQARDKLFLVKPGEQRVLLPGDASLKTQEGKGGDDLPNWKQWWQLFF